MFNNSQNQLVNQNSAMREKFQIEEYGPSLSGVADKQNLNLGKHLQAYALPKAGAQNKAVDLLVQLNEKMQALELRLNEETQARLKLEAQVQLLKAENEQKTAAFESFLKKQEQIFQENLEKIKKELSNEIQNSYKSKIENQQIALIEKSIIQEVVQTDLVESLPIMHKENMNYEFENRFVNRLEDIEKQYCVLKESCNTITTTINNIKEGINNKSTCSVLTGTYNSNMQIPLPAGYTEEQCKFFWTLNGINRCYIHVTRAPQPFVKFGTTRNAMISYSDPNNTNVEQTGGTWMVIGIK